MFIAIAAKRHEYLYRSSTRLAVPKASAGKIAKALTDAKYRIKDGEVWHPFETEGEETYGKARLYKGNIRITYEYGFGL